MLLTFLKIPLLLSENALLQYLESLNTSDLSQRVNFSITVMNKRHELIEEDY
jgi:hypothetical protein